MTRRWRLTCTVFLAAAALIAAPATAYAHDPENDHGTHPPTGGGGPDLHSANMTLVKNLPKVDNATQSDLAFEGDYAYAGTFSGFRVIDISNPATATQVAFKPCNGGQGDVSVYNGLLFSSVDTPQSKPECDSVNATTAHPTAWEGVRIFDVRNPADIKHIASVRTDCGSHTHTLAPAGQGSLFIYVSSYAVTTTSVGPNCRQFHGKISVIHVPLNNPAKAQVVSTPETTGVPVFEHTRLEFANPVLQDTRGCHDITVLKPLNLAAAACLSVGQIWDISDRAHPRVLHTIATPQVKAWHSAQFTWDGTKVTFGDEAGGGAIARCRAEDPPTTGAVWTYDVATAAVLGHYKIPRAETGVCTMHNFNYVPGIDRDILVSSAYTGGTTVADLTDPANPVELGFYRPGDPIAANTWSSYWHNGFIYGNDINRGVDIFAIDHPAVAGAALLARDNPQTQERLFP
ncbi:LVIVD repeat-containing protein [Actinokineospora xionganensis]|uniref:LVIVD repeat-containing protein n=1 Tax=Actinokineospora xionganensis TaxID=2684470 RepID=A0ABR7LBR7_9PSEU|nr:hypothetical protein [Actinokineospora xionganensis]MBC6450148.1 hypothetical protein [Actinokineospora xionganensis]